MIDYRVKHLRILDQVLYLLEPEQMQWQESPDAELTDKILLLNIQLQNSLVFKISVKWGGIPSIWALFPMFF